MANLSDKIAPIGVLTPSSSIKDLSDVYTSMSPTDGQVLTYDTTNGWQAETTVVPAATEMLTATAGDTLVYRNPALASGSSWWSSAVSSWLVQYPGSSSQFANIEGTVRFRTEVRNPQGYNYQVKFLKNGTELDTQSGSGATFTEFTLDVSIVFGDVLEIRSAAQYSSGTHEIQNTGLKTAEGIFPLTYDYYWP